MNDRRQQMRLHRSVVESLEARAYFTAALRDVAVLPLAIDRSDVIAPAASVSLIPPGASLDSPQPAASDESSSYNFNVTYTDAVAIDASTLGNNNLSVTFPDNSQTINATLISTGLTSGPIIHATYQIAFSHELTTADDGGYEVAVLANSVQNTSQVAITAGFIGILSLDVTTPVAPAAGELSFARQPTSTTANSTLSAVAVDVEDANGNLLSTDDSHVTLALAGGGALLNGSTTVAAIDGVATFSNLSISAAGNDYALIATDGADTFATSALFNITAPTGTKKPTSPTSPVTPTAPTTPADPTPPAGPGSASPVVPTLPTVSVPTSVVAGSKLGAKLSVVITNSSTALKGKVTVNIYADTGTTLDGNQVLVTSKTALAPKAGKTKTLSFSIGLLPKTLADGTYYLLAEVIDPNGATSLTTTSQTVQIEAPIVLPTVAVAAVAPASVAIGKSASVLVTVTNNGNVVAKGVSLSLSPSVDGVIPLAGVVLKSIKRATRILPSKSKTFILRFRYTSKLPADSYLPLLSAMIGGVSVTAAGSSAFVLE